MSWLLVAFIPGLLMLATFGLDRLEAGLSDEAVSADDVAEFLQQARAESVRRAVPVPKLEPPTTPTQRDRRFLSDPRTDFGPTLPTRVYVHHGANPQFQPTRQADRV